MSLTLPKKLSAAEKELIESGSNLIAGVSVDKKSGKLPVLKSSIRASVYEKIASDKGLQPYCSCGLPAHVKVCRNAKNMGKPFWTCGTWSDEHSLYVTSENEETVKGTISPDHCSPFINWFFAADVEQTHYKKQEAAEKRKERNRVKKAEEKRAVIDVKKRKVEIKTLPKHISTVLEETSSESEEGEVMDMDEAI